MSSIDEYRRKLGEKFAKDVVVRPPLQSTSFFD